MADRLLPGEPEPRDERTNLTRAGLAARRARLALLRGDPFAREGLDDDWAPLTRTGHTRVRHRDDK